jgi:hypothetical protein
MGTTARLIRALVPLCALLAADVSAQNEEDVLRYSMTQPGGTARSWGMGSAFGAVGADPASASINPAGFGLYNVSELSITPVFGSNNVKSSYYGNSATAGMERFALNNLSLVLNVPNTESNWRGGTFGFSFDRQSSYHQFPRAVGERVPSTIIQRFVNEADGVSYADLESDALPFTSTLAWYTYAIDTVPGTSDQYQSAIPWGSEVEQVHTVDASGRLNTSSFLYANNYMDRIYIGATLGLVGVRFERHTVHEETTLDENIDLRTVRYSEDLLTTGSGLDLKLGVIGRVGERVRLGGAFHSPMWLSLNDAYSYNMRTDFRAGDGYKEFSPEGTFSYRVNTPWRTVASAVYQVEKVGLISVDYTYTNFSAARLRATQDLAGQYDFAVENDVIRNSFVSTNGLRVGTEWRTGGWYFRAGWGFQQDPYAKDDRRRGTALRSFSGGVGYRATHVSIDLAGVYDTRDTYYFPYSPDLVDPIRQEITNFRTLFTVALRP